jgi:hypothetical protein
MAGLVLGGPAFRAAIADAHLSRRVQFRAISLLKRETRATAQGNVITFSLPSEGLSRAVQYARDSELWIVNLSVTGPNRSDPIEGLLLNNPNLLLVVASGNAPLELDLGSPRYPASYSKLENGRRGKVVTVGSHDRRGCFSTFAGRGPQTVDLAAPGENITSIGLGGAAVTSEGTSQATALVSFTAALLRYEGLISASAIKDRLLASVDLQPHLAEFVRSQGALDIVKAVSLNDDVLQLRDDPQKLLFGRLAQPPTLGDLCPALQGAAAARLLKISRRVDGGDASQIRIMFRWRLDPDILQVRYCRPNAATLTLTDTGGTEHRFRLEDVLDLVPAG